MERLAGQLPQGFGYEWTGQSREEKLAGAQALILYGFAILAVFLCLAALYESWSIPLAVILVVPLGVLGVLLATLLRGYSNDVYFQVGLITIIGLSAKNAILIIEFAKDLQAQGKGLIEATLEAVHLRFRPIIMTSLAFILGVLPLVVASGAGSASFTSGRTVGIARAANGRPWSVLRRGAASGAAGVGISRRRRGPRAARGMGPRRAGVPASSPACGEFRGVRTPEPAAAPRDPADRRHLLPDALDGGVAERPSLARGAPAPWQSRSRVRCRSW